MRLSLTERRFLRINAACVSLVLLCACQTPAPRTVFQRVEVPVPVYCSPKVDLAPKYPMDSDPIADDIAQAMKDLHADRDLRRAWQGTAIAALKACAGQ